MVINTLNQKQQRKLSTSFYASVAILILSFILACGSGISKPKPSYKNRWTQGTYIWDSRILLDQNKQAKEIMLLEQQGMSELLVGLTGEQIKNDYSTKPALRSLIKKGHRKGIKVKLLLGDPQWIMDTERYQLIAIINNYRQIQFDGIHLDLEPEQLGWPVPKHRLQELTETIQKVIKTSPWPVSLSIHPRWFEPMDRLADEEFCLPCGLDGLESINLMSYQRNTNNLVLRIKKIAEHWPNLNFRLAQSVEDDLGAELSWHGSHSNQLAEQVMILERQLHSAGINGVDWQDWSSYPKGVRQ